MDLNWLIYGPYTPEKMAWILRKRIGETPGEWKERIWARLMYFGENKFLPIERKSTLGQEHWYDSRWYDRNSHL